MLSSKTKERPALEVVIGDSAIDRSYGMVTSFMMQNVEMPISSVGFIPLVMVRVKTARNSHSMFNTSAIEVE